MVAPVAWEGEGDARAEAEVIVMSPVLVVKGDDAGKCDEGRGLGHCTDGSGMTSEGRVGMEMDGVHTAVKTTMRFLDIYGRT